MPACIYCIENKTNGHCYIGQTKNFVQRRSKHFSELRRNAHHNSRLQKAYNKYGEQNFQIYILEEQISDEEIGLKEDYWIDKKGYYNVCGGRKAFTPTALRNMSVACQGIKNTNRKLTSAEAFYTLVLNEFLDGIERSLAAITGFSRTVFKSLIKGETYKEIYNKYCSFTFETKIILLKAALHYFNFNPWRNPNCACPNKNRYMLYVIQKASNLEIKQIADILQMAPSGIRRFLEKYKKSQVKINTILSDDEVKCILQIILDEQHRAKILGVETMRKQ